MADNCAYGKAGYELGSIRYDTNSEAYLVIVDDVGNTLNEDGLWLSMEEGDTEVTLIDNVKERSTTHVLSSQELFKMLELIRKRRGD